MSDFKRANFCLIASGEAMSKVSWKPNTSSTDPYFARRFTFKYEKLFGQGRIPWCAAFVVWCLEQAGLKVPLHLPYVNLPSSLCQAWEEWAKYEGHFSLGHTEDLQPGDILLFDWDKDTHDDHMGIFLSYAGSKEFLTCAEGNYSITNATAITNRKASLVRGWIRLPDSYDIPQEVLVG